MRTGITKVIHLSRRGHETYWHGTIETFARIGQLFRVKSRLVTAVMASQVSFLAVFSQCLW